MAYRLQFEGLEKLSRELRKKSNANWANVINYNLDQIEERAKTNGGTPYKKGGLQRLTGRSPAKADGYSGEFGYNSEYAAHVEFGHRIVVDGQEVGYVQGQHFLQHNLDAQRGKFIADLMAELKK